MMPGLAAFHRCRRGIAAASLFCALFWHFGTCALADEYRLAAQTKIQISIVQWNPTKGEYLRWEPLGGTFQVSPEGTIALPVVGSLHVSDKTTVEVAALIATELRKKAGLLSAPEVTVEVAEYPRIYVVGGVTTPGAYACTPGLTVLQAVAIAGGRYRPTADKQRLDKITLAGELATIRGDKLRLIGRIARLQAENSGDAEITFPPELTTDSDVGLVAEVIALERMLFAARANETSRQLTTLAELRDMYTAEIQMLDLKSKDSGKEIALTEEEAAGLTKLVQQGIATVSRWSDMRRVLSQLKAAHNEDEIATMRVRQNLSDARRQEFGIHDKRQTEAASELQQAEGDLARLRSREETLHQLQLNDDSGNLESADGSSELTFTIVRQGRSGSAEVPASESTPLLPGDVLKVTLSHVAPGLAASASSRETSAVGVTQ